MQHFVPYIIQHIKLDEIEFIPKLETGPAGVYAVYWWKDIALGHMYFEAHQYLKAEEYFERIKKVIIPTITFYLKKSDAFSEKAIDTFKNSYFEFCKQFLEESLKKIYQPQTSNVVPVSVIVCTRNRPGMLLKCLQQLKNLTCIPEEIIVIDNASDDDSSKLIVEQFNEIRYIKELRLGLDFARNTGAKNATQPIIAYVDDDVIVDTKWLYWIWDTFRDETVAAMTGLVIASKLDTDAQQIFEKYWSFNRGYIDKTYDTAYFKQTLQKGPPVWEIGAGANMAFRKSIFEEVGYFDELLDVGAAGCNGDSEMWFRILANNHTILYNPRAVVFHEHRSELKGLKKQIYFYMRGYTAAALSQQEQVPASGYYHQIFKRLPIHYLKSIKKGFPNYGSHYKTIWVEIKGVLSGLVFYTKNRNHFRKTNKKNKQVAA